MTEQRKAEFAIKLREIYQWANAESLKVFKRRIAEGGYLDRNKDEYAFVKKFVQAHSEPP